MTPASKFISPFGKVVRTVIHDQPILFTITDENDDIQTFHKMGRFYEEEELGIIEKWCQPGSVFCDVGANIGNHSLFALKFLPVRHAVLFEPNPIAIDILRSNLILNGVADRCDFSKLGFGLSDRTEGGYSISAPRGNLGAGRLVESPGNSGTVQVARGDDLLAGQPVDFVKIDIEGMEISALAGLSETIDRFRPRLFVEVAPNNHQEFFGWVSRNGYEVVAEYSRYRKIVNYMAVPASQPEK